MTGVQTCALPIFVVEGGNKAVPGQPVRIQQASVQDAKLPDQPVGTGSDSGKAE